MSKLRIVVSLTVPLVAIGTLLAAEGVHWSYSGPTGPEHWAELSPEFAACGIGLNQSPVDITNTYPCTWISGMSSSTRTTNPTTDTVAR